MPLADIEEKREMPCGVSFRGPKAETGADISKVINVGKGSIAAKNLNLKLKIISSLFCTFFCFYRSSVSCLFFKHRPKDYYTFNFFFYTLIMIFHCLLLFIPIQFIFKEEYNCFRIKYIKLTITPANKK